MSAFITETVEESPVVLLIGVASSLRDLLARQLAFQGLQSQFLETSSENSVPTAAQLNQVELDRLYKVIWLVPGESLPSNLPLEFKHLHNLSVVVLTNASFTAQVKRGPWQAASQDFLSKFPKLLAALPQAGFYIGLDVLTKDWVSPLWQQFSSSLAERKLEYFQIPVFPQTVTEFVPQLVKSVLTPKTQSRVVIRGRSTLTRSIAQVIMAKYEDVFQVSLELKELTAEPQDLVGFETIVTNQDSQNWKALVESLTRQLPPPSLKKTIEEKSSQPAPKTLSAPKKQAQLPPQPIEIPAEEARVVRIPAAKLPAIENRLKKMEKIKAQALADQQRKKFLPPTKPMLNRQLEKGLMRKELNQGIERDLEQQIQNLFGERRVEKKLDQLEKKVKKTAKVQKKNKRKLVLFGLGVIAIVVILAGVSLWFYFQFSKKALITKLLEAPQVLKTASSTQIQAYAQELDHQTQVLTQQVNLYQPVLSSSVFSDDVALTSLGNQLAETAILGEKLKATTQTGVLQALGRNAATAPVEISVIISQAQELYKKLSVLQAELASFHPTNLSSEQEKEITALSAQLQEQRKVLASLEQVQPFLNVFLGQQGKRNYLVLLQNEQQLKPSGGVIHAVALMTFEKGSLTNFQVVDLAGLDAQLRGTVQAPADFKAATGQSSWGLRDANWSPDFPETAKQAQWFFEKSSGKKVDGVIALNLSVLKNLIQAGGPIALPEYNEIITDRNLMERVGFHSEAKLVQAQKYDYLTVLFTKAFTQFTSPLPEKSGALLEALFSSLNDQQLLISMNATAENESLKNLGWTGSVTTPPCPAQFGDVSCVVDTLYLNEMNVGANAVNPAIQRTVEHQLNLNPTTVTHQEVITLRNTATSNAWPLGSYKAYLRLYVPINAQFVGWTVNGQTQPVNQLTLRSENNKIVYGVTVEVPIQASTQIGVSYSVPINQTGEFAYTFFDQKQPGTGDDAVKTSIHFDQSLRPVLIAPQAEVSNGTIQFTGLRDKNRFVGVKFKNS